MVKQEWTFEFKVAGLTFRRTIRVNNQLTAAEVALDQALNKLDALGDDVRWSPSEFSMTLVRHDDADLAVQLAE